MSAVVQIEAVHDAALGARLGECRELPYAAGASPAEDRPASVRAASGLAWLDGELAVAQDDASFIGLVGADGAVRALALPRGPGGRRVFEERLGNKQSKLDLEASFGVDGRLVAFGSGSRPERERVVVVERGARARVVDASAFYRRLRDARAFAGTELNVEGAVALCRTLRLFQRGNGAPRDGLEPVNATVDLDAFLAWLDGGAEREPPALGTIRRYDLGSVSGVTYGFTDAAALGDGRALFLAGAEDSPDAVLDGAILGARIGVLDSDSARFTDLVGADGRPAIVKAEGILPRRDRADVVHVVLDPDDPDRPAVLCDVVLTGPW